MRRAGAPCILGYEIFHGHSCRHRGHFWHALLGDGPGSPIQQQYAPGHCDDDEHGNRHSYQFGFDKRNQTARSELWKIRDVRHWQHRQRNRNRRRFRNICRRWNRSGNRYRRNDRSGIHAHFAKVLVRLPTNSLR